MTYFSALPDRAVLALSGADAREFLQGLITNDARKITPGKAVFAALLSPQGRFLFDFIITEQDGRLLLETEKARLPDLKKRLLMYRLRSQVEFTEMPELQVSAAWGGEKPETAGGITYEDPRLPGLGWRMLGTAGFSGMEPGNYDAHRLAFAVPEGSRDLTPDRSLLLEYGYDELHGVDFDKGCYVGQEVTARSKHRATLRKFVHSVKGESALPPKGAQVLAGGREAGVMCSSAGNIGLAHLRVEEVGRAAREGVSLMAGDAVLTAILPPWCRTRFQDEHG